MLGRGQCPVTFSVKCSRLIVEKSMPAVTLVSPSRIGSAKTVPSGPMIGLSSFSNEAFVDT